MKANAPNELIDQITVQARSLSWASLVDNRRAFGTEVGLPRTHEPLPGLAARYGQRVCRFQHWRSL